MNTVVSLALPFFGLILLGYVCGKRLAYPEAGLKWMNFFIVYLGWISVATIANITAWLVSIGWKGLGIPEEGWSTTMMATAILLGVLFIRFGRGHAYAWVIAWALFGIHGSQAAGSFAIGQLALGGIAILLLYSAYYKYMDRYRVTT